MELTDTLTLSDRPMNTLSGGEAQRVFLAAAVAQKTRIMLLDEPMSFLDPQHQEIIRRSLDRIHTEFNTTIIAVTHDVNHALHRFSHIGALVNGKALFCGPSTRLKENASDKLYEVYSVIFSETVSCVDGFKYYVPKGLVE
jgi:ABC-type cobalamin/Fe3+-siderophores transport system ATPase subunit